MNKVIAFLVSAMFSAAALAAAHTAAPASAGPDANAKGAQQNRAKSCNAQAKGMKRKERRAFLKTCLAGNPNATVAPESQTDKSKPALESPKP
jgi:psiF repeat